MPYYGTVVGTLIGVKQVSRPCQPTGLLLSWYTLPNKIFSAGPVRLDELLNSFSLGKIGPHYLGIGIKHVASSSARTRL